MASRAARFLGRMAAAALLIAAAAVPVAAQGRAGALLPQRPGVTDVYVLSFGLWGTQSVFESEAKGAARVLEPILDSKGRTLIRFNTKTRADATPRAMKAAAEAVGRTLDPEEDIAVVLLTSHGGHDGIGLVFGRTAMLAKPDDIRQLLAFTRAKHRVLIVSACYSGLFARELADPKTLVITAAAADRPSFGCRDGATWTYFGEAFFAQALREEASLDRAFARARTLVTEREVREKFDPSNPQIAGGEEVLPLLARRAAIACTNAPAPPRCGSAAPPRR